LKESETKDQIVKRAQIQGLILNLTRFGANSRLNETARFGKNDAVSRTVHLKKKREAQNGAVLTALWVFFFP
jgi:hypothetical protein